MSIVATEEITVSAWPFPRFPHNGNYHPGRRRPPLTLFLLRTVNVLTVRRGMVVVAP